MDQKRVDRIERAEARRLKMTAEVVPLGMPKSPPYANSTPEERLAAAVRLIHHHEQLRGAGPALERSKWPGEAFVIGSDNG